MITGIAYGQRYQVMPQPGYGPVKRMLIDSVLTIPTNLTGGSNITSGRDTGKIRYNIPDSSLQVYTGYQWWKPGVPLSSITAATATNSIDNANYGQTWNWTGLTSNAMTLLASTTASSPASALLTLSRSGANASVGRTTYALTVTNQHTGTTATNYGIFSQANSGVTTYAGRFGSSGTSNAYGLFSQAAGAGANIAGYFNATSGTSNYAIIVPASGGSVGIGTSAPDSLLTVEEGIYGKRGVRFSGLPTGVGTKAVRIDGNGVLSVADTTAGGGLTVGTTTITSGTNTKVLYNNSGVVGEYTVSGSGNVAMTTSPAFTTPDLGTPSALVGTNITGTAASLTAGNATTLATSRNLNNAAFNGSANVLVPDQNPSIMALLGGAILAEPVTGDVFKTASSANLTDGQVRWVAVYIPGTMTITGIKWIQQTQGNYTADNYNGVGLYSYSGGNLTLVASSTNDGNIWKATSFTWSSKAFSSTYAASPGLYFAALIYNSSAQTTAPALRVNQLSSDLLNTVDFTNSAKFGASLTAQTTLPAGPTAMSTLATMSGIAYLALY
mgnify:CR=1 FL=1